MTRPNNRNSSSGSSSTAGTRLDHGEVPVHRQGLAVFEPQGEVGRGGDEAAHAALGVCGGGGACTYVRGLVGWLVG